jgi:hypothetical protein
MMNMTRIGLYLLAAIRGDLAREISLTSMTNRRAEGPTFGLSQNLSASPPRCRERRSSVSPGLASFA